MTSTATSSQGDSSVSQHRDVAKPQEVRNHGIEHAAAQANAPNTKTPERSGQNTAAKHLNEGTVHKDGSLSFHPNDQASKAQEKKMADSQAKPSGSQAKPVDAHNKDDRHQDKSPNEGNNKDAAAGRNKEAAEHKRKEADEQKEKAATAKPGDAAYKDPFAAPKNEEYKPKPASAKDQKTANDAVTHFTQDKMPMTDERVGQLAKELGKASPNAVENALHGAKRTEADGTVRNDGLGPAYKDRVDGNHELRVDKNPVVDKHDGAPDTAMALRKKQDGSWQGTPL